MKLKDLLKEATWYSGLELDFYPSTYKEIMKYDRRSDGVVVLSLRGKGVDLYIIARDDEKYFDKKKFNFRYYLKRKEGYKWIAEFNSLADLNNNTHLDLDKSIEKKIAAEILKNEPDYWE